MIDYKKLYEDLQKLVVSYMVKEINLTTFVDKIYETEDYINKKLEREKEKASKKKYKPVRSVIRKFS